VSTCAGQVAFLSYGVITVVGLHCQNTAAGQPIQTIISRHRRFRGVALHAEFDVVEPDRANLCSTSLFAEPSAVSETTGGVTRLRERLFLSKSSCPRRRSR
jgi:hypothetical protein